MITTRLPYYEFKPGIFEIDEFDCVSVFVVVGKERALVIDCGSGIGNLRQVIEKRITDKPYDVVVSHNHGDHIGGAGFFDAIWINSYDADWENAMAKPTLEFRKRYARFIANREGKHYDYDVDTDIRPWERIPQKKMLEDGHVFDLGGRTVTAYRCPGHTEGEMVFIDDLSKTLLVCDACNNFLLIKNNSFKTIRAAKEGLERIVSMKDQYDDVFNSHHDYRGFGNSLYPEILQDAIHCYQDLLDHTAHIVHVSDPLDEGGKQKVVAEYGKVQISSFVGAIDQLTE